MHSTPTQSEPHDGTDLTITHPHRVRNLLLGGLTVLLIILVLAFIPPLINVSRFQHRIERNISNAVGRNVTFDRVSLALLPLPGFTLDNFVIDEDPAFGSEPILRADQVKVTLRISSLWHPHVEFSTIALTEPTSVNLVRRADGHWNIESLLTQATHIDAAPTAQRFAGPAPRFPYIQATGARLNLKLGAEKMPFSLTDTEFALWLPEAHQWHLRLLAHPTRTDLSPGDTGTIRAEGTLGNVAAQAASLAQIPIDIHGSWQDAQLGDLSRLVMGSDAGLRGDFSMTFNLLGTVDRNTIVTGLKLVNGRRADFVPPSPLTLEMGCHASAANTFHAFANIECHWPPADSSDPTTLIASGSLPDVHQPQSGSVQITLPALPADTFFNWIAVASPHPPVGLGGPGNLAGTVAWGTTPLPPRTGARPTAPPVPAGPNWSGELEFSGGTLDLRLPNQQALALGDVILRSSPVIPAPTTRARRHPAPVPPLGPDSFDLLPVTLDLGGKVPAIFTGHLNATGYTLHMTGTALPERLLAIGDAIPQIGDGLKDFLTTSGILAPATPAEAVAAPATGARGSTASTPAPQPIPIDLTATCTWGSGQIWQQTTPPTSRTRSHSPH